MPTSLKEFEGVFTLIVADLLDDCKARGLPASTMDWYEKSLYYNCVGGKCNRGLAVPDTVSIVKNVPGAPGLTPSSPDFVASCTLGWLIELLQACFLVQDDIMDTSITRRGQPCWYRAKDVGMVAINDASMLQSAIFVLLRKHFGKHVAYLQMIELFLEVTFQTQLGQSCDLLTAPEDDVDLARFSLDKYTCIVVYKTAFYSFYLPVALALLYCQVTTPEVLRQAHDILILMGEYFQVQDDYLDAYADPSVLGKVGTDILDNKCSWLINQALMRCTPTQRKVLEENYGRRNGDCESRVKAVYTELKLDLVFEAYSDKVISELEEKIGKVDESQGVKQAVYMEFLSKISGRTR